MESVYDGREMKHTDDIWRAANFLLEQYGTEAQSAAAQHSEWLLQAGDAGGHLLWTRIIRAIQELGRAELRESERPN